MGTLQLKNRNHPALEKAKAKQEALKLVPKPEPKPVPDNLVPITKPAKKKKNLSPSRQRYLDKFNIEGNVSLWWFCNNRKLSLSNEQLKAAGLECISKALLINAPLGRKYQQEDKQGYCVKTYPIAVLEEWLADYASCGELEYFKIYTSGAPLV